jgi:hypothetical protein
MTMQTEITNFLGRMAQAKETNSVERSAASLLLTRLAQSEFWAWHHGDDRCDGCDNGIVMGWSFCPHCGQPTCPTCGGLKWIDRADLAPHGESTRPCPACNHAAIARTEP